SSSAEPASRPRREIVNSDIVQLPSSRRGRRANRVIMGLGKGFARDGFGASWLGFEISVRWTSRPKEALMLLSGRTRL
ncbi:hypothetical protein, partial [Mesorhizobium sp.]|uniref:hypothetical protein n=1 Tax=Mesorhizobium sp. TaxID=1871066 RepID=UPI0025EF6722